MKWFVWPHYLVEPQDIEGYRDIFFAGQWVLCYADTWVAKDTVCRNNIPLAGRGACFDAFSYRSIQGILLLEVLLQLTSGVPGDDDG